MSDWERTLAFATGREFVDHHEAEPEPLIGSPDEQILPAGGFALVYGDGGAGKTTLLLDLVAHLASGLPWLGLATPRPLRVLLVENEGPRPMFRAKLRRKAEGWEGPEFLENVTVLAAPWGELDLRNDVHRDELAQTINDERVDVLVAGPLKRLGAVGAGTPDEAWEFARLLEYVIGIRPDCGAIFAHHENKAGLVSGAWEGVPDTLLHVELEANGRTKVTWKKARWASSLHGRSWVLKWAENAGFEVIDTGVETRQEKAAAARAEAVEWMRRYLERVPDASKNKAVDAYKEAHAGKGRDAARDAFEQVRGEQTAHPAHLWSQPPVEAGARVRAPYVVGAHLTAHPAEGSAQVRGDDPAHPADVDYWSARDEEFQA